MADLAPADWAEDHGPAAPAGRGAAGRSVRAALRPQHFEVLVSSQSSCDLNDRRPIPFQPCSHPRRLPWVIWGAATGRHVGFVDVRLPFPTVSLFRQVAPLYCCLSLGSR